MAATKAFQTEDLELLDGTQVTVKSLEIARLKKLLKEFAKLGDLSDVDDQEEKSLDVLVTCAGIAISKQLPDIAANRETLEDALDTQTIYSILRIAAGIELNDPKLIQAALDSRDGTS